VPAFADGRIATGPPAEKAEAPAPAPVPSGRAERAASRESRPPPKPEPAPKPEPPREPAAPAADGGDGAPAGDGGDGAPARVPSSTTSTGDGLTRAERQARRAARQRKKHGRR